MIHYKTWYVRLVLVTCILSMTIVGTIIYYIQTPASFTEEQQVIIRPGTSIHQIALSLGEKQVVSHPYLFSFLLHISKLGRKLKPGEYVFIPGITPLKAYQKLARGDTVIHRLTIPEGLMTSQIMAFLGQVSYLEGDLPDDVPEGALLPETYACNYGDTRRDVVQRMRVAMQETLDELWESRSSTLGIKTKEEALIIASIVEKETHVAAERKKVAAVFMNRLKRKMRLQMDPTVIYAITKGKYVLERPLSQKDLEINDPYNTYQYDGLPPGPITNPGRAAIEATLNPEQSENIYFVADGSGGHFFSKTLKEHEAHVSAWRKLNSKKEK